MIKIVWKVILILIAVILQVTLMPMLNIQGVWPNIILISAIILLLLDLPQDALLLAGIGGLGLDLFSSLSFGFNTIFFIAIVLTLSAIYKKFFPSINLLIISAIVFAGSLLFGLYNSLILFHWQGWGILIEGIYASFLGLLLFFVINFLHKSTPIIKVENERF